MVHRGVLCKYLVFMVSSPLADIVNGEVEITEMYFTFDYNYVLF